MSQRTCTGCGKDFVQTFGGRPRRKCYDCVPPRLNQNGGQSHDSPGTKPGRSTDHGSASQKDQCLATPASTVGKHAGKLALEDPSADPSQRHCPWCGAYPDPKSESWPFCNPLHRAELAAKVARAQVEGKARHDDNGRLPSTKLAGHKPRTQRPLERVREIREAQVRGTRSKAPA